MPTPIFEEIQVKSVINKVNSPLLPFRWTINPYRGCQHACVYCFARNTHTYLGYDAGKDFNQRIVVKVNAPEVLRTELQRPRWKRELIAMGTACDPYEPAEAKYFITRQMLQALRDFATPVGITTKSNLVLRDMDTLTELAQVADVTVNFSIATLNEDTWRRIEPGTPKPMKRLQAMERLSRAGIRTGVLLAPILPDITDSEENLEEVVREAAQHGAHFIAPNVLHLKPGSKEWFLPFLREAYPHLTPEYLRLYRRGAYAPRAYTEQTIGLVQRLRERWGLMSREGPTRRVLLQGQISLGI